MARIKIQISDFRLVSTNTYYLVPSSIFFTTKPCAHIHNYVLTCTSNAGILA